MTEPLTEGVSRPEVENKAKVFVLGTFGPDDIEVEMSNQRMPKTAELEEQIKRLWAPKAAKGWFPGPVARLESFGLAQDGKLLLVLGKTDFREYIGSRDIGSLRKYGYEGISNPLCVSVVVVTADGKFIIGQRVDKEGADAVGSIDAIGGYADPQKDINPETGKIDVFRAARREVEEEARIKEDEISEQVCLGLSYEYASNGESAGLCHPVVSLVIRTPLSSEEVLSRKGEEIDVIAVDPERIPDSDLDFIMDLLAQRYPKIEPDGRITIALVRKWLVSKIYPKRILRTTKQI